MITINNLCFAYPAKPPVIDALSAHFRPGLLHGLLGPNGSGKSTLLQLVAGLAAPASGEVLINGAHPFARAPATLADIAHLPQVLPTTRMNSRSYANLHALFWPQFSMPFFDQALELLGVESEERLTDMSYGQRKKALLAFTLATGARVMLLDEPTDGLDIDAKSVLRKLLVEIMDTDRTIIIATHQVREFEGALDHVSILGQERFLLHADIHDLAEALVFGRGTTAPADAIHSVARPGGRAFVSHGSGATTQPDLEVLYSAVLKAPEKFADMGGKAS